MWHIEHKAHSYFLYNQYIHLSFYIISPHKISCRYTDLNNREFFVSSLETWDQKMQSIENNILKLMPEKLEWQDDFISKLTQLKTQISHQCAVLEQKKQLKQPIERWKDLGQNPIPVYQEIIPQAEESKTSFIQNIVILFQLMREKLLALAQKFLHMFKNHAQEKNKKPIITSGFIC